MTKILYEDWNPTAASRQLVQQAEDILIEKEEEGYTLSLRQLYYQLVARNIIENSDRSYKNLGNAITKARLAGMISWHSIEDRHRGHQGWYTQEDPLELIQNLPDDISFDIWGRQDHYIEVWVEKDALINVVERACGRWKVPYMACKGYLSASEAWRAGRRFSRRMDDGKQCHLIHLGDHDPSGIDMTRDNKERMDLFTQFEYDSVNVHRIALNMDQIDLYSPPPNPAKVTDSRAKDYIKRYGETSWELDALEPSVMVDLIQGKVKQYLDMEVLDETLAIQKAVKAELQKVGDNWSEIQKFLRDL